MNYSDQNVDIVEYAIKLADRGEHVVPVRPNGAPYDNNWRYNSPPTAQQLRAFFRSWRDARVRVVRNGVLLDPLATAAEPEPSPAKTATANVDDERAESGGNVDQTVQQPPFTARPNWTPPPPPDFNSAINPGNGSDEPEPDKPKKQRRVKPGSANEPMSGATTVPHASSPQGGQDGLGHDGDAKSAESDQEPPKGGAQANGEDTMLGRLSDVEKTALTQWGQDQLDKAVANIKAEAKAHIRKSLNKALGTKLAPLIQASLIDMESVKKALAEACRGEWTPELDQAFAEGMEKAKAPNSSGGLLNQKHPAVRLLKEIRAKAAKAEADAVDDEEASAKGGAADDAWKELERRVLEMNERYFVVSTGGRARVGCYTRTEIGEVLTLINPPDFTELYAHEHVWLPVGRNGAMKPCGLGAEWRKHEKRRTYDCGFSFDSNGPRDLPSGRLNLWRGWGVEPKPGQWPLLKNHILTVLANGNPDNATYIYKWLAWKFQNPGERARVALVFRSLEGSGKSIFWEDAVAAIIFGAHSRVLSNPRLIAGNFNAHLRGALFVLGEEAFFAGDKTQRGTLYSNITAKTLMIEPKGIDPTPEPNRTAHVYSTNLDWAVPAGENARRFAVFDTSNKHAQDQEPDADRKRYFSALNAEIKNGGAAAMLDEMLNFPLGDWKPWDDIPRTKALQDQKHRSLVGPDRWYFELLQRGVLPQNPKSGGVTIKETENRLRPGWAAEEVRHEYGDRYGDLSAVRIGIYLQEKWGYVKQRESAGNYYVMPPLAIARAAWEAKFGACDWGEHYFDWGGTKFPESSPPPKDAKK